MKYTIEGFSQRKAVEMGLTTEDIVLLRWFVDFYNTGLMKKFVTQDGNELVWVDYKSVLEELPIIRCNKRNLTARFDRLVKAGVLIHETIRDGGLFSTYGFGENYISLISDTGEACTPTSEIERTLRPKSNVPYVQNQTYPTSEIGRTRIHLQDNSSTSNNTPLTPQGDDDDSQVVEKKSDLISERFGEFWKLYPKKTGKGAAEKAFKRIKPDKQLFETMMSVLKTARASPQWQKENGRYIPNPSTWLNQKRWEDDYGLPDIGSERNAYYDGYDDPMDLFRDVPSRENLKAGVT